MIAFESPVAYSIPDVPYCPHTVVNSITPITSLVKTVNNHVERARDLEAMCGHGFASVGLGYLEALARMHNRLMHSLNGNLDSILAEFSIPGSSYSSYAQLISAVPPIPPGIERIVDATPFARITSRWPTWGCNIPQIMTALALIELSTAGHAWGVKLGDIPSSTSPSSKDYILEVTERSGYWYAAVCVEWFFVRSGLDSNAPMDNVNWKEPFSCRGIKLASNAVQQMLHAAWEMSINSKPKVPQEATGLESRVTALEKDEISQITADLEERITALESRRRAQLFADLEARIATLELQRKTQMNVGLESQSQIPALDLNRKMQRGAGFEAGVGPTGSTLKAQVPTVTCLMHLFASQSFAIPPHTDRMSALPRDAQRWFIKQLWERKVWVHVTEADAEDNHISWSKFEGAQEMDDAVLFSYGNFRFWATP